MKKNYYIDLQNVILLPYLQSMVKTYNEWMQDPELLDLTGSDPLSLEEEYQNQQSWLIDPSKHTFIIIEKNQNQQYEQIQQIDQNFDFSKLGKLIGDVNLYFHEWLNPGESEIGLFFTKKKL